MADYDAMLSTVKRQDGQPVRVLGPPCLAVAGLSETLRSLSLLLGKLRSPLKSLRLVSSLTTNCENCGTVARELLAGEQNAFHGVLWDHFSGNCFFDCSCFWGAKSSCMQRILLFTLVSFFFFKNEQQVCTLPQRRSVHGPPIATT